MTLRQAQKLLADAVEFHRAGRLTDALARYQRILAHDPGHFDANHLAGLVALQEGRTEAALSYLEKAHRAMPEDAVCEMRLALAYSMSGWPDEAERRLRSLTERMPEWHEAWDNLGSVQQLLGRLPDAIASYRRAVAIRPDYALGWCNLGLGLLITGSAEEGLSCQDRALAIDPRLARALRGRAMALHHLHRMRESICAYDEALRCQPNDFEAMSYRLLALHYLDGLAPEALYREHLAFGAAVSAGVKAPAAPAGFRRADADRRLRIAFLSPDLRTHSVAYFIEPIVRNLDRRQFEVVLYHDHFVVDATSERLRSASALWRNFAGQSGPSVAARIRADAPDILVDLAGHSGLNRLPLFAERLAAVQISYLGYPDTTGLGAMDFRLVDEVTDPVETADAFATERLVRFAPTAWAYAPPAEAPEPRIRASGPIRFGSCNSLAKVSDSTLRLWSSLLAAVPQAKLRLKAPGFEQPAVRFWFERRLDEFQIERSRVECHGWTATVQDHLAFYQTIDVALDCSPYNGTTTTCEALWMGVPVVTLAGDHHAARVGKSLLAAAGCSSWVAHSEAEYVRIAAALAADESELALLRHTLRPRVAGSVLLDHADQAARFGAAVRRCWVERVAGLKATSERAVA